MNISFRDRSIYYRVLILGLLLVGVVILFRLAMVQLTDPRFLFFDDFVEYWSAGKLNLTRGNPYDPEQLTILQLQTGRVENVPIMMWNPPWTLTLVMPFGALPYSVSRVLWLLLNIGIIFLGVDWAWRFYEGPEKYRWVAWLVAFSFGPSLRVLKIGQISPLLLLGVVGFLYFNEHQRSWWAGAALSLITVKPHLVYLVGLAVLCWAIDNRRWSVLLGGGLALSVAMGIAWGINPALVRQYRYALLHYPPEQWATPTLGAVLRALFGPEKVWLQFIPAFMGSIWFVLYWRRHHAAWVWREQLPLIILVSVLTSAYGWVFDHAILLLALLPVALALLRANWKSRPGDKIGLLVVYLIVDGLVLFSSMEQLWYWWLVPFFLGWYLLSQRFLNPQMAHKDVA